MIRQLDGKQQRTLAVSLFVVVLLVITSIVAIPAWSVNAAYRERIGEMQGRLYELRQMADTDKDLRPRYEQIRNAQRAAGNYLQSSTVAVAAAELQGILKNLAAAYEMQVLSTQIVPAAAEDEFVRVALRARLRGPLPGIVDTLYAIESNDVYLFLDHVSVRNGADRRRGLQTISVQFETDLELITYMPADL